MNALENIKHVFFVGIGGIGMSALARYFLKKGACVYGYDQNKTALTQELEKQGAVIYYQTHLKAIERPIDLVVITPAIPDTNLFISYAKAQDIPLKKRAEVLGLISRDYKTIAVAGTHGKTSTSAIIADALHKSDLGCTAFIGGILTEYNTNFLYNDQSPYLVVEADEFDRSFLHLNPWISIIGSIEADHLDIYENQEYFTASFIEFARLTQEKLIVHHPLKSLFNHPLQTFSTRNKTADLFSSYPVVNKEISIHPRLPGEHNLLNTLAAVLALETLGLKRKVVQSLLNDFKGVKRRFEYVLNTPEAVVIDDYAHHPTEIKYAIQTARDRHPEKPLTVVFQPHLFSRTRDFMDDFALELRRADTLFLLDIYPARESPIEGINSQVLCDKISPYIPAKCSTKKTLTKDLSKKKHPLILILGAGDIYLCIDRIKQHVLAQ